MKVQLCKKPHDEFLFVWNIVEPLYITAPGSLLSYIKTRISPGPECDYTT